MDREEESKKPEMAAGSCFIAAVNKDVVQNILSRLPAKSFAFASSVCRSWNVVCGKILSRPKIVSAFSLVSDADSDAKEAFLDKVLSEPIRPDFVIANVTGAASPGETLNLVVEKVGSRVPIIVSYAQGILGKEASSDTLREVKEESLVDEEACVDSAILLTIGYMPGLKIDVVPLDAAEKEPEATIGAKFVRDIRTYVSTVSDQAVPVGIILFEAGSRDARRIIEKLDDAMPAETCIVGAEFGELDEIMYNGLDESQLLSSSCLTALVFARDRKTRIGDIRFHTFVSGGVSQVGPRYEAASVEVDFQDSATYLRARRERHPEIVSAQQIVDEIDNLVANVSKDASLYIGVIRPRPTTSLICHAFIGTSGQSLNVEGTGIGTGDGLQFFYSDADVALASLTDVCFQLRNVRNNNTEGSRQMFLVDSFFQTMNAGNRFSSTPMLKAFRCWRIFMVYHSAGHFRLGKSDVVLGACSWRREAEEERLQFISFFIFVVRDDVSIDGGDVEEFGPKPLAKFLDFWGWRGLVGR